MNSTIEMSVRCAVCKKDTRDCSPGRPTLCVACAEAADVAEIVSITAGDMTEAQYDLVMRALQRLKTDATAFGVIREYAALLNGDVAAALFLEPGAEYTVCISPDELLDRKSVV